MKYPNIFLLYALKSVSKFLWDSRIDEDITEQINFTGPVGHEHPPLTGAKTAISGSGGAKSDAPDAPKHPKDGDLAAIIKAWPDLPEHIKQAIIALVQTH